MKDKTIWARQARQQNENATSFSSPPQTTPATAMTENDEGITEYPPALLEDLDVIKEFIQQDKDSDYIPLMSAIALKEKKRMRFLPIDFNTVKIDALLDSGAYINAISENNAEKLRQNSSQCIINQEPRPLSEYRTPTLNSNNHLPRTPYVSKLATTPSRKRSLS